MKIAEALLLRSDLQKKTASLRERIAKNAVVQDGESPHENPNKLLKEAFSTFDQFESLVVKINQSNAETKIPDGRTLTESIAHRDNLVSRHSYLHSAIQNSHKEPDRYSRSEIKWITTMDVVSLQKQAEDMAKNIRVLNAAIQETNWKTELID